MYIKWFRIIRGMANTTKWCVSTKLGPMHPYRLIRVFAVLIKKYIRSLATHGVPNSMIRLRGCTGCVWAWLILQNGVCQQNGSMHPYRLIRVFAVLIKKYIRSLATHGDQTTWMHRLCVSMVNTTKWCVSTKLGSMHPYRLIRVFAVLIKKYIRSLATHGVPNSVIRLRGCTGCVWAWLILQNGVCQQNSDQCIHTDWSESLLSS